MLELSQSPPNVCLCKKQMIKMTLNKAGAGYSTFLKVSHFDTDILILSFDTV